MSTYRGSYIGIGRLFQRPGIQRACRNAAVEMKGICEATAPVGNPAEDSHPGRYKASFDVVPVWRNIKWKGQSRWRAGARLVNTSPEAWRVEKGDGRVPRYAVMQRAIDTMKAEHRA